MIVKSASAHPEGPSEAGPPAFPDRTRAGLPSRAQASRSRMASSVLIGRKKKKKKQAAIHVSTTSMNLSTSTYVPINFQ